MSEVKPREFTFDEICEAQDFNHGDLFVLKSDYDSLKKENERLKKHIEELREYLTIKDYAESADLWIAGKQNELP